MMSNHEGNWLEMITAFCDTFLMTERWERGSETNDQNQKWYVLCFGRTWIYPC